MLPSKGSKRGILRLPLPPAQESNCIQSDHHRGLIVTGKDFSQAVFGYLTIALLLFALGLATYKVMLGVFGFA